MKKNIILFDMDGTLTEPRKCVEKKIHKILRYLVIECKAEIGIVTGSGMDYIQEQVWPLVSDVVLKTSVHLLPCNGTEYWIPPERAHLAHILKSKADMQEHIGDFTFRDLMTVLCDLQVRMINEYSFPLTGNFISNRKSMVNWCPIGRNANNEDRDSPTRPIGR